MSAPDPTPEPRSQLRRRRDELAEQVADLHWNLGGLTYEMAIRDHFRLDVLIRRAAMLQERDAELAEVDRLLHMEEDGVAGSCAGCGAVHSRGAIFCWQCGAKVMHHGGSIGGEEAAAASEIEAHTIEIDVAAVTGAGTSAKQARSQAGSRDVDSDGASHSLVSPHHDEGALGRPVQASP